MINVCTCVAAIRMNRPTALHYFRFFAGKRRLRLGCNSDLYGSKGVISAVHYLTLLTRQSALVLLVGVSYR